MEIRGPKPNLELPIRYRWYTKARLEYLRAEKTNAIIDLQQQLNDIEQVLHYRETKEFVPTPDKITIDDVRSRNMLGLDKLELKQKYLAWRDEERTFAKLQVKKEYAKEWHQQKNEYKKKMRKIVPGYISKNAYKRKIQAIKLIEELSKSEDLLNSPTLLKLLEKEQK